MENIFICNLQAKQQLFFDFSIIEVTCDNWFTIQPRDPSA